jgi:hypothetical protein
MTNKKIHSEINFFDTDFKIKICTTNKKNPETLYVQLGTYLKPIEEKNMYTDEMYEFDKISNHYLRDKLKNSQKYSKNFILVTEIADERMNTNKKSFLDIQIHFKRSLKKDDNFKKISNELYSEHISDFIFFIKKKLNDVGFEYFKNKK